MPNPACRGVRALAMRYAGYGRYRSFNPLFRHTLNPGSRAAFYFDGADPALDLGPNQVDVQQTIVEPSTAHFDTFGENKRSLKLPRGDAAVQIDTLRIVRLLATNHELVVFDGDAELAHLEAGHSEGYAQRVLGKLLDIVGRVTVGRYLADPIERPLKMVKAQEQWRVKQRQPRHATFSSSRSESVWPAHAARGHTLCIADIWEQNIDNQANRASPVCDGDPTSRLY